MLSDLWWWVYLHILRRDVKASMEATVKRQVEKERKRQEERDAK